MSQVTIIGGGIAGLALAKSLQSKGIEVKGLEKEPKLGGRIGIGHHRLYSEEARDLLKDVCPTLSWVKIDEDPIQLRKGEAGSVGDDLTPAEQYYLGRTFYQPERPYEQFSTTLENEVGKLFQTRKLVTEIALEKRELHCLGGEKLPFERLVWTSTLSSLLKACGKTPVGLGKGRPKKKSQAIGTGGLTWDILTSQPLFDGKNTLVFPFRYKDSRLRALGMRGPSEMPSEYAFQWTLFLDDSWLENREELAKVVRTFKRELGKQFTSLEGHLNRERLVFHSSLAEEPPVPVNSLEVFPGVVCVGPDIQTEAVSPTAERSSARNLDALLLNCLDFVDLILPQWQKWTAESVEPTTSASDLVDTAPVR